MKSDGERKQKMFILTSFIFFCLLLLPSVELKFNKINKFTMISDDDHRAENRSNERTRDVTHANDSSNSGRRALFGNHTWEIFWLFLSFSLIRLKQAKKTFCFHRDARHSKSGRRRRKKLKRGEKPLNRKRERGKERPNNRINFKTMAEMTTNRTNERTWTNYKKASRRVCC